MVFQSEKMRDHETTTVAAWSPAGDELVLVTMSQRVVTVAT
jgi:hypothetical protein